MKEPIELRAFMGLMDLFKDRGWASPLLMNVEDQLTGRQLLELLDIPGERVEVFFINGKVSLPGETVIHPGDRVALVPPGTPGPYRVLLGFKRGL